MSLTELTKRTYRRLANSEGYKALQLAIKTEEALKADQEKTEKVKVLMQNVLEGVKTITNEAEKKDMQQHFVPVELTNTEKVFLAVQLNMFQQFFAGILRTLGIDFDFLKQKVMDGLSVFEICEMIDTTSMHTEQIGALQDKIKGMVAHRDEQMKLKYEMMMQDPSGVAFIVKNVHKTWQKKQQQWQRINTYAVQVQELADLQALEQKFGYEDENTPNFVPEITNKEFYEEEFSLKAGSITQLQEEITTFVLECVQTKEILISQNNLLTQECYFLQKLKDFLEKHQQNLEHLQKKEELLETIENKRENIKYLQDGSLQKAYEEGKNLPKLIVNGGVRDWVVINAKKNTHLVERYGMLLKGLEKAIKFNENNRYDAFKKSCEAFCLNNHILKKFVAEYEQHTFSWQKMYQRIQQRNLLLEQSIEALFTNVKLDGNFEQDAEAFKADYAVLNNADQVFAAFEEAYSSFLTKIVQKYKPKQKYVVVGGQEAWKKDGDNDNKRVLLKYNNMTAFCNVMRIKRQKCLPLLNGELKIGKRFDELHAKTRQVFALIQKWNNARAKDKLKISTTMRSDFLGWRDDVKVFEQNLEFFYKIQHCIAESFPAIKKKMEKSDLFLNYQVFEQSRNFAHVGNQKKLANLRVILNNTEAILEEITAFEAVFWGDKEIALLADINQQNKILGILERTLGVLEDNLRTFLDLYDFDKHLHILKKSNMSKVAYTYDVFIKESKNKSLKDMLNINFSDFKDFSKDKAFRKAIRYLEKFKLEYFNCSLKLNIEGVTLRSETYRGLSERNMFPLKYWAKFNEPYREMLILKEKLENMLASPLKVSSEQ